MPIIIDKMLAKIVMAHDSLNPPIKSGLGSSKNWVTWG